MGSPSRIVYFAALAQTLGLREELVTLEAALSLAQLREQLIQRGGPWQALAGSHIKAAINHSMASATSIINPGDEVAFFPPVTGG